MNENHATPINSGDDEVKNGKSGRGISRRMLLFWMGVLGMANLPLVWRFVRGLTRPAPIRVVFPTLPEDGEWVKGSHAALTDPVAFRVSADDKSATAQLRYWKSENLKLDKDLNVTVRLLSETGAKIGEKSWVRAATPKRVEAPSYNGVTPTSPSVALDTVRIPLLNKASRTVASAEVEFRSLN